MGLLLVLSDSQVPPRRWQPSKKPGTKEEHGPESVSLDYLIKSMPRSVRHRNKWGRIVKWNQFGRGVWRAGRDVPIIKCLAAPTIRSQYYLSVLIRNETYMYQPRSSGVTLCEKIVLGWDNTFFQAAPRPYFHSKETEPDQKYPSYQRH